MGQLLGYKRWSHPGKGVQPNFLTPFPLKVRKGYVCTHMCICMSATLKHTCTVVHSWCLGTNPFSPPTSFEHQLRQALWQVLRAQKSLWQQRKALLMGSCDYVIFASPVPFLGQTPSHRPFNSPLWPLLFLGSCWATGAPLH